MADDVTFSPAPARYGEQYRILYSSGCIVSASTLRWAMTAHRAHMAGIRRRRQQDRVAEALHCSPEHSCEIVERPDDIVWQVRERSYRGDIYSILCHGGALISCDDPRQAELIARRCLARAEKYGVVDYIVEAIHHKVTRLRGA